MIQAVDQTSFEQLSEAYRIRFVHCIKVYNKLHAEHTSLTQRLTQAEKAVALAEKEYVDLTPQNWMQSNDESVK